MNTLKAIATELVVPESTLRIYRDEFEEFVVASGEGRRRRYDEAATGRLKQIVQWKRNGWTSAQVRDALLKEAMPQARVRRRSVEERLDDVIALLRVQGSEALLLRAEIGALRSEIRRLVTEIGWDTPLTMEQVLAARKDSEDRED